MDTCLIAIASTTMTDVWHHCQVWFNLHSTINHFIMSADPIATTVTRAQTVESYCNGGN